MKLNKIHIWLSVILVIVLAGFWPSYLAKPMQVPFRLHIHGITATLWFILLIIQPYLYSKKKVQLHRKLGMLSLILAGGVIASAILMIPHFYNGPFAAEVVRKIILFDVTNTAGFAISVCMAIVNSKNVQVHARWMVTTAFWALPPALARLLNNVFEANGIDLYFNDPANVIISLILLLLVIKDYVKEKKIYVSYVFVFITNILLLILNDYISNSFWWESLTDSIFNSAP